MMDASRYASSSGPPTNAQNACGIDAHRQQRPWEQAKRRLLKSIKTIFFQQLDIAPLRSFTLGSAGLNLAGMI